MNIEDVRVVKEEFADEYMEKKPWRKYINSVGISKVWIVDKNAPKDKHEDLCIVVGLGKKLPKKLVLPNEYNGVAVYSEFIGKIQAQ